MNKYEVLNNINLYKTPKKMYLLEIPKIIMEANNNRMPFPECDSPVHIDEARPLFGDYARICEAK